MRRPRTQHGNDDALGPPEDPAALDRDAHPRRDLPRADRLEHPSPRTGAGQLVIEARDGMVEFGQPIRMLRNRVRQVRRQRLRGVGHGGGQADPEPVGEPVPAVEGLAAALRQIGSFLSRGKQHSCAQVANQLPRFRHLAQLQLAALRQLVGQAETAMERRANQLPPVSRFGRPSRSEHVFLLREIVFQQLMCLPTRLAGVISPVRDHVHLPGDAGNPGIPMNKFRIELVDDVVGVGGPNTACGLRSVGAEDGCRIAVFSSPPRLPLLPRPFALHDGLVARGCQLVPTAEPWRRLVAGAGQQSAERRELPFQLRDTRRWRPIGVRNGPFRRKE